MKILVLQHIPIEDPGYIKAFDAECINQRIAYIREKKVPNSCRI